MSGTIFPFRFLRSGFAEYLSFRNEVHEQGGGRRTLQRIHAAGELVVRGRLLFPQAGKVWRIGYLTPALIPRATLFEPLRRLGYVDGQTARFEIRTADNELSRLPALAADLARTPVDVIIAVSPPAIVAAKQATSTIPIVMPSVTVM